MSKGLGSLISAMKMVLNDQADNDLFTKASDEWREHSFNCSLNPEAFFATEREIARDAQLCLLQYRILSSQIGNVRSKGKALESECIGLVFEAEKCELFSPILIADDEFRNRVSGLLKSSVDESFSFEVSKLVWMNPVGSGNIIPYEFLFSMRNSLIQSVSVGNYSSIKLPTKLRMQMFILASVSLKSTSLYSNNLVKVVKKEMMEVDYLQSKVIRSTKDEEWRLVEVGSDIFPLFRCLWGGGYFEIKKSLQGLLGLTGVTSLEFECVEVEDMFMRGAKEYKVLVHISFDGGEHKTVSFAQTTCPAIAIGWLCYALGDEVSPYIKISSRNN